MSDIPISELKTLIHEHGGKNFPHVILEIGANSGVDTKLLLTCARKGFVHCFECDPRAIARWRTQVRTNRAAMYEVALSDSIGKATFHPSGGNPGGTYASYGDWDLSGSLLPFDRHHENAPWMIYRDPITVDTTTLDEWAKSHLDANQVISFVWIDVQGAEAMVFRGGKETLKRVRYVFAECDPRPNYKDQATKDELIECLPGFQLVKEYPGFNLLFKNTQIA